MDFLFPRPLPKAVSRRCAELAPSARPSPSCSGFWINAGCGAAAPFGSAGDGVASALLALGTAMGTARVSRSRSRVSRRVGWWCGAAEGCLGQGGVATWVADLWCKRIRCRGPAGMGSPGGPLEGMNQTSEAWLGWVLPLEVAAVGAL